MVPEVMRPGRLKVTIDPSGEIWIRGDSDGLAYLAHWCQRIIGKTDPAGHMLLQWQMNNLLEGSSPVRLEYIDDDAGFD